MSQRTLMMIAAALTAFVLVLAGGVATRLAAVAPAPAPTDTAAPASAGLDPAVEARIREREAAYQAAIDEANRRLVAANEQIAQANAQIAQAPAQAPAQAVAEQAAQAPSQAGAEQAAQAAVAYRGGGAVREVDAEHERGQLVYDVRFDDGASVYVSAATGQVIYASLGGHHEEREHEEREHDD